MLFIERKMFEDCRLVMGFEEDDYAESEFTQNCIEWSLMDLSCLQPEIVSYLIPPWSEIQIKPYDDNYLI